MKDYLWQGKPWQAFKSFAIIFSFTVNFILLIVLLLIAPLILPIVSEIVIPIVSGLTVSFEEMGDASIVRTVPVNDNLGIEFNLPLNQQTVVVLSEDVPLNVPATVSIGAGSVIYGTVDLTLPKGLELPVQLTLDVPVSQTIPVELDVSVEIPLNETELGTPFSRLKAIFKPLDELLKSLPADSEELTNRLTGADQ